MGHCFRHFRTSPQIFEIITVTDPFPFLVSIGYRHQGTMGCQHS